VGPYGGNARALAYDPARPDHILLGSGAGTLFESLDGGRHWRFFTHLGVGDDLMLEDIAFDPSNPSSIYVAGWSVNGSGGSFFLSRDGGRSWREPEALRGKSMQALAVAASDPRILVAGALDGLYRSKDRGEHWERISPVGHADLKNFESVAIDPRDPKVIYAGTWHLPWKTTDGGATWSNMKQGLIDDSDVFSIIIDNSNPQTVFASACSGIYKSVDGGQQFHKIQGIPNTARRTRVLMQDPKNANTVYAGTTEGLYKSIDAGQHFQLITPKDYILNDVMVDPRDSRRVLLATDRGGVYASDNGGATFYPSNDGFSQRQISSLVADREHSGDLYAGVLNDKEFGGVFRNHNGVWTQMSDGLGGADVFDLGMSKGTLVAATNRGVYLLHSGARTWQPSRVLTSEAVQSKSKKPHAAVARSSFDGHVRAVALTDHRWYAAADGGILHSENEGASWSGGVVEGEKAFLSVSAHGKAVAAASMREVWYSTDDAQHWERKPLPSDVSRIYSVTITADEELWAATREGALHWVRRASGAGAWERVGNGLPWTEVNSIREAGSALVASVAHSKTVYVSRDHGTSWKAMEPAAAFEVTGAVIESDVLRYLTSRHHGVLVQDGALARLQ
jgi:photosystem II stability/assembly factor-like uncharacterized protein